LLQFCQKLVKDWSNICKKKNGPKIGQKFVKISARNPKHPEKMMMMMMMMMMKKKIGGS
jgi:hypothetical protein